MNTLARSIFPEIYFNTSSEEVSGFNLPYRDHLSSINQDAVRLIKSFSTLKENWDSYGANVPSRQAIHKAVSFVVRLSDFDQDVFFTCPTPDGDILVELRNGLANLEFEFSGFTEDTVTAIYDGDITAEADLNETTQTAYLKWLICPHGNCPPDLR